MWRLLFFPAGLAIFFMGMFLLRQGLSSIWEQQIIRFIRRITSTPLRGLLAGTGATVLLQSSSAVTVLTMGLIDAKVLAWPAGLGIVLGTNIGTCTTAQLLSFHLESYWWLLLTIGVLNFAGRKYRHYSFTLWGLGLILAAMQLMTWSGSNIQQLPPLATGIIAGIVWGALITAVIQSSSAFMAVIIALSANQVIGLEHALPLILGSNLGTCITAGLASIGGSIGSKKLFYSHLLLNLAGIIVFVPLLPWFAYLLSIITNDTAAQIAAAHTIYNVLCSLAALPFTKPFTTLLACLPPIDNNYFNQ